MWGRERAERRWPAERRKRRLSSRESEAIEGSSHPVSMAAEEIPRCARDDITVLRRHPRVPPFRRSRSGSDQCSPSLERRRSTRVEDAPQPDGPEFTAHMYHSKALFRTTVGETI